MGWNGDPALNKPRSQVGKTLVLILGDQLSPDISALKDCDPARTRVLMCEVMEEASYVPHHRRKLVFVFSAMRHHAAFLRTRGWQVDYVALDDPQNTGSLFGEVVRACAGHDVERVRVTEPGEWRLWHAMQSWSDALACPVDLLPDTRFLCPREFFEEWARGRRQLRMEYFYREMRRRTGLLMAGDAPLGGQWNFDADNREAAKPGSIFTAPPKFAPDAITREVMALVDARFPSHVGVTEGFWFAVTAEDASAALQAFITHALPGFGATQDAMLTQEPFLNHAVISPYLNVGLLDPLAVCRAAEAAFHAGQAPIAAVEGFIRQIIGWREYVRGVYWREMPAYAQLNHLQAMRPLPDFYWNGQTDLACLRAAITQTLDEAYAHHIQRLMITGTFALLVGVDPDALHRWYLAVYADAYEWVELPNTLGMSQFADGGLLASKPYAASGAYVHRMSDYCGQCRYKVSQKTGNGACPLNSLYWDFIARHADKLRKNPRMAQMYRTWERFAPEVQIALRAEAKNFLETLPA